MAEREYPGEGIVVHWDSDRCFHSERCTMGLPRVFDRSRRPWVRPAGVDADDIAGVIDTCPSGALTYTRTDGAANGRRGRAVDEDVSPSVDADPGWSSVSASTHVTITPTTNGPLQVTGPFQLTHPDGSVEVIMRTELCRCGHSAAKPFCDGSHVRVGFTAPGAVPGSTP